MRSTQVDEGITRMGATIIDSLDVLHIMGLTEELALAKKWVMSDLVINKPVMVSVFECTIRILGGLLAAHALTHDKDYLIPAEQLGNALLKAFKPGSLLPCNSVNLQTGCVGNPQTTTLAEAGTLLMEFRELTRATGNPAFEKAARASEQALVRAAYAHRGPKGLLPEQMTIDSATPLPSDVQVDGGADSYYE
jgi:hypothetical protein